MAISAKRLPRRTPSAAWHPSGPGAPPHYRPRHPAGSALYAVVQHHLETFLAQTSEADPMGYGLPTWIEKDFSIRGCAARSRTGQARSTSGA